MSNFTHLDLPTFQPGFRLIDGSDLETWKRNQYKPATGLVTLGNGNSRANGLNLTAGVNQITTVTANNDAVVLPLGTMGVPIVVINEDASNTLTIITPMPGDLMNRASTNVTAAAGTTTICWPLYVDASGNSHWHTMQA